MYGGEIFGGLDGPDGLGAVQRAPDGTLWKDDGLDGLPVVSAADEVGTSPALFDRFGESAPPGDVVVRRYGGYPVDGATVVESVCLCMCVVMCGLEVNAHVVWCVHRICRSPFSKRTHEEGGACTVFDCVRHFDPTKNHGELNIIRDSAEL